MCLTKVVTVEQIFSLSELKLVNIISKTHLFFFKLRMIKSKSCAFDASVRSTASDGLYHTYYHTKWRSSSLCLTCLRLRAELAFAHATQTAAAASLSANNSRISDATTAWTPKGLAGTSAELTQELRIKRAAKRSCCASLPEPRCPTRRKVVAATLRSACHCGVFRWAAPMYSCGCHQGCRPYQSLNRNEVQRLLQHAWSGTTAHWHGQVGQCWSSRRILVVSTNLC